MASHIRNSALYRDRLTENELISDYPADEQLIDGLHALQAYFVAQNRYIDIPVVRVMNTAHFLACYMFSIPCTDRNEYDVILYEYVGYDKQLALITLVVLAAMLRRTDAPRARTCRSVLLDDRCEDLYEGVSLYEKCVNDTQQTFPTEAFDTDIMSEVISLRNQNNGLIQQVLTLQSTIETMKKERPQIINNFNIAGNYIAEQNIDIHDNTHCSIYATGEAAPSDTDTDTDTPQKGDEKAEVNLFTKQAHREGKEQEIIAALQRSFVGRNDKARALVEEVREWQKEGYIDPHYNARVMYEQLNRTITLPFEYGGFRKYYNE